MWSSWPQEDWCSCAALHLFCFVVCAQRRWGASQTEGKLCTVLHVMRLWGVKRQHNQSRHKTWEARRSRAVWIPVGRVNSCWTVHQKDKKDNLSLYSNRNISTDYGFVNLSDKCFIFNCCVMSEAGVISVERTFTVTVWCPSQSELK